MTALPSARRRRVTGTGGPDAGVARTRRPPEGWDPTSRPEVSNPVWPGPERVDLLGDAHREFVDAASRLWMDSAEIFAFASGDVDAKVAALTAVMALASDLLLDGPGVTQDRVDLDQADVEAAIRQESLPCVARALADLCRPVSDPSNVEWPGCFDHFLYHPSDFAALTTSIEGARIPPALWIILLAAGLTKFMGRFGNAERIYLLLADSPLGLCKALGLIGLGDLHNIAALWARHLHADEKARVSATAAYGIAALLRSTLRWSGLREVSFDTAAAHYERAVQIAPELPLAHYSLALLNQAIGRTSAAIERFEATQHLLVPGSPLSQSVGLRIERLLQSSEPTSDLPEGRNWLRLEQIDNAGAHSIGLIRTYSNIAPSEMISYHYDIHDRNASWKVATDRETRELVSFPADGIRILGPGAAPIALRNRYLLSDTLLFTRSEQEVWNPREIVVSARGAIYVDVEGPSIQEDVIVLPGLGSFYFHFLFDVLGALSLVLSHEQEGRKIMFSQAPLQKSDLFSWQQEILSMLGISPDNVILCPDASRDVQVNKGIVCSYPSQNNAVAPSVVRSLRRLLVPVRNKIRIGKRVFFTRTTTRLLQGDRASQLAETARDYGFKIRDPMRLSVRQQRDILADCEVFMAEAGSALSNILFLPPGAKVVMLATKLGFKDYFCPIATSLDIEMHVVLSDIELIYPRHQFLWSAFRPDVDLETLKRCLDRVI